MAFKEGKLLYCFISAIMSELWCQYHCGCRSAEEGGICCSSAGPCKHRRQNSTSPQHPSLSQKGHGLRLKAQSTQHQASKLRVHPPQKLNSYVIYNPFSLQYDTLIPSFAGDWMGNGSRHWKKALWSSASWRELLWDIHENLVFAGMAGGLRAAGPKADIALIVAEAGAASAGVFTQNLMCAAPVTYCKEVLDKGTTAKAVSHALRPAHSSASVNQHSELLCPWKLPTLTGHHSQHCGPCSSMAYCMYSVMPNLFLGLMCCSMAHSNHMPWCRC